MTPPYLKKGDKVGIVSSASRISFEETKQGIKLLRNWGLVPIIGNHTFKGNGFFSGLDNQRIEDLQQMLDDESIKAIFFTRGGYGTLRIIDQIDFSTFKKHPKWIVGYSDITVLHNHIHNFNIETLHAVMLQGIPTSTSESVQTLQKAIFGESLAYEIPNLPINKKSDETIEGILVGGNLSMLYALIGSESDITTDNKILFIEDINEYLYHVDRMLISLKRSGKLANLKAIIVGGMVEMKESTIPFGQNENEIVIAHTRQFDYPVYFGFPSGHIKDNRALVLGRKVTIETHSETIKICF